ncbi:MAG: ORF6N domain-containing protein [Proteobacteria bacterium]|nr:ORF6N domain-containing protein [Pseudomonadota bacterium]
MPISKDLVPVELIESKIFQIRGRKVMLDSDLALLYCVETKQLNRAVKRNAGRFPDDFMFQLTDDEADSLRCQTGTSKTTRGGRRYSPHVFTEQGVAMLSSVLISKRAIQVNIQIMRVFTRLRQMLLGNADLRRELEEMKRTTDDRFQIVFETLDHLLAVEERPKRKIGFAAKEQRAAYTVKQKK